MAGALAMGNTVLPPALNALLRVAAVNTVQNTPFKNTGPKRLSGQHKLFRVMDIDKVQAIWWRGHAS
jgi:hypothetical protein